MRKMEKYVRKFTEAIHKPTYTKLLSLVGRSEKGHPREGWADVINDFIDNMNSGMDPQKAFIEACDNQNFYGDRSDIVKERKGISGVIQYNWNIYVDPVKGF